MRPAVPLVATLAVLVLLSGSFDHVLTAQTTPDRAADVLAAARAAMGGDARIAAVKTFIATGRTRQIRGNNLVPIEFEIQAELPDRYTRRDEFPAQDNGPATVGFNRDVLVQNPPSNSPPRVDAIKQDFARLMLGLFASSYSSFPLTFAYVAQAEAPQGKADVLDVMGPGNFRARFFISSDLHLPMMLTWQAPAAPARGGGPPPATPAAPTPQVEQRMFFGDYRSVDGLQLPYRIRRGVGAETTEETVFDRFRINTRIDAKRFQPGS
jgi:hypothetical protein